MLGSTPTHLGAAPKITPPCAEVQAGATKAAGMGATKAAGATKAVRPAQSRVGLSVVLRQLLFSWD
jgi:hypothetical protein